MALNGKEVEHIQEVVIWKESVGVEEGGGRE